MKKWFAIIAVFCLVLSLSSCKEKGTTRPTEYDGKQSVEALVDYAKRLEANGDYEAAAELYEVIAKAAVGPLNASDAEDSGAAAVEEYKEARDLFSEFKK